MRKRPQYFANVEKFLMSSEERNELIITIIAIILLSFFLYITSSI